MNVKLSNKRKIILEDKNSKKKHLSSGDSSDLRNQRLHPENPSSNPGNSEFTQENTEFTSEIPELHLENTNISLENPELTSKNQISRSTDVETTEKNNVSEKKLKKDELLLLFNNCVTALSNNKICTYNAFDIGIIDHIDDLIQINEEETAGTGAVNGELRRGSEGTEDINYSMISKVVESASKVYSYRVEAIYNKTFNILTNIKSKNNNENANINNKRSKKNIKLYEFTGKNTLLLKNEVTLTKLEVDNALMDPYFLKISSLFNNSLNLLMLNILINNLLISLFNTNTYNTNSVKDSTPAVTDNGTDLHLNKKLISEIVSSDKGTRKILPEINEYIEQLYGTTHNPFDQMELIPVTDPMGTTDVLALDGPVEDLSDLPEAEMVPEGSNEPLESTGDTDTFYDAISTHEFPDIYTTDNSNIISGDFPNTMDNSQESAVPQLTDLVTRPEVSYLSNVPGTKLMGIDNILENVIVKRERKTRELKPVKSTKPVISLVKFVVENNLSTVLDSIELLSYYNKKIKFNTSNKNFNLNLNLNPNKLLFNTILISNTSGFDAGNLNNLGNINNLGAEVKFGDPEVRFGANEYIEDAYEPGMGEFDYGDDETEATDSKDSVVDINKLKKGIMKIFETEGRNISFSQLISSVYKKFNRNVVTVHIIFVCLLHVSNEHNLFLAHGDSTNNFSIQQE